MQKNCTESNAPVMRDINNFGLYMNFCLEILEKI